MLCSDVAVVLLYNCLVVRGVKFVITGSFYVILLVLRQCIVLESLTLNNQSAEINNDQLDRVEVRALLVNCANETDPTDTLQYEREELLKYGELRTCIKKLALTVKLYSTTAEYDDEYLPVEHVTEGRGRARVRLLNAYVLRLRRDPPVQAYKVRRTDIVRGTLTSDKVANLSTTRDRRNNYGDQYISVAAPRPLGRSVPLLYDLDREDAERGVSVTPLEVFRPATPPPGRSIPRHLDETQERRRGKRHEYNVIVEDPSVKSEGRSENYNERAVYDDQKDNEHKQHSKRVEVETPESLYEYITKRQTDFNRDEEKTKKNDRISTEIKNDSNSDVVEENTKRSPHIHHGTDKNMNTTDSVDYNKLMAAADYALYEVGDPEIWHTIRIQLFEKTTTSDGKTVWNDLTGGTPISIGSIRPEWKNEDLVIRYHPLEKVEHKEFAFPNNKFRLLVPLSTPSEKYFDKIHENADGDYIVVPDEDITYLDDDSDCKNSEMNYNTSTPAVTAENATKLPRKRRVVVRVTRRAPAARATPGGRPALVRRGADRYLTVPHPKPHPVQIDLEARADDNHLVRVGASGSIAILVADCTRPARTIISVHVTNTGLAAAPFRTEIQKCGFDSSNVSDEERKTEIVTSAPELIPPRHTRRFQLELPVELPSEIKRCTVALVNNKDKAVAVREVSLKKGDRCFCVWYCECTCLGVDPKLTCYAMTSSRAAAAGLSVDGERLRQRSICYPSELTIDISYFTIILLLSLILPGLIKAIIGLCSPAVARWGLDSLVEIPPKNDKYYEPWLRTRPVVRDKDGWPIHPDTNDRSVHTSNLLLEFFLNTTFCLWIPWVMLWDTLRQSGATKGKDGSIKSTHVNQVFYTTKAGILVPHFSSLSSWMSPYAEKLTLELWLKALHMMPMDHLFQGFKHYSSSSSSESTCQRVKCEVPNASSNSGGANRKKKEKRRVSRKSSKQKNDESSRARKDHGAKSESNTIDNGSNSSTAQNVVEDEEMNSSDSSKRNVKKNIVTEYREKQVARYKKEAKSFGGGGQDASGESDESSNGGRNDQQYFYMFQGSDRDSSDTKYVLRKMKESKKSLSRRQNKKDEDGDRSLEGPQNSRSNFTG